MKTKKQIWMEVQGEVDKLSFNGEIEDKKYYSKEEIKKAISKCYSYDHARPLTEYYNDKDDNLICIAELEEHLFAKKGGTR